MRGQRIPRKRIGRRRLARSRRGVAAILGALFAVLIFLAVFGLVLTQALPVWMAQDESAFTQSAQGAFASLQATIGTQSASGVPRTAFTPISLSSSSVPVLASATIGSVSFAAPTAAGYANVSWTGAPTGVPAYQNLTLGQLSVDLPNRYIPPETLDLQDGAVFELVGTNVPVLEFAPAFQVLDRPGNLSLSLAIVSMSGLSASVSGPGTHSVADTLLDSSSVVRTASTGTDSGFAVTLELGSSFACAWGAYYLSALTTAGLAASAYTIVGPTSCTGSGLGSSHLSLTITSVHWAVLETSSISVSVGED